MGILSRRGLAYLLNWIKKLRSELTRVAGQFLSMLDIFLALNEEPSTTTSVVEHLSCKVSRASSSVFWLVEAT
jgi:hypothetical protein